VKALEKAKDLSEDDARKGQEDIQKLTDECIAKADQVMAEKENELMQI
jgi:ribosome recycling factor